MAKHRDECTELASRIEGQKIISLTIIDALQQTQPECFNIVWTHLLEVQKAYENDATREPQLRDLHDLLMALAISAEQRKGKNRSN